MYSLLPYCHKCKRPLTAAKGCAVCTPLKDVIRFLDAQDVEADALSLQHQALTQLQRGLELADKDGSPRLILDISRAIAVLSETIRKAKVAFAREEVTADEQMRIIEKFFVTSSSRNRAELLKRLNEANEKLEGKFQPTAGYV